MDLRNLCGGDDVENYRQQGVSTPCGECEGKLILPLVTIAVDLFPPPS